MMVRRRKDLEAARAEHDQYIDPNDAERHNEFIVQSRGEDGSVWWRLSWYLQKYLALWTPLAIIGAALGFTLITPKRSADELRTRIDSVAKFQQAEINQVITDQAKLRGTHDSLTRDMTLLIRFSCVQKTVTNYDKRLVGLLDAAGECIR